MTDSFKYFAFISYNSLDKRWGKSLHKRLEHYRMPSALCSQHGWKRTPMRPIFFAPTDIQPGPLSDELKKRLENSRHLIVVCSPNSAQSEWVGKEIEYFNRLGRTKNIHFFIVDGTPHSGNPKTECYNPIIKQLGLPEILAANIHEKTYLWPWLNKERAYTQLISKLLGVEFDSIWQRHKRLLVRKASFWTVGLLLVVSAMIGIWRNSQPFDIELKLNEATFHNGSLPPLRNAVVTMQLNNETKCDTVFSVDTSLRFTNIPHQYLNKEMHFSVSCPNFVHLDTVLPLSKNMLLNLYRNNSIFGAVRFRLYNPNSEQYLSNVKLGIAGQEAYTDTDGYVSFFIPLHDQRPYYIVKSSLSLEQDTVFVPCNENCTIMTKER